ncbi:hypothetical protein [Dyadobacter sp. CY347]|uniref:hypothetical protein n=1 Tax=Dyadobacter sp. CY347 TaxID=2909336 RepID=UPI001F379D68|nr:hypothetical protein [Dyadobacter sp. CY347]MCF2491496.1 hypothetical protein [Dyadobacter sp. CY347]
MTAEDQRKGILGSLVLLGIGAVVLTIYSLSEGKYEVCAAALAVIVSVLASGFAYEVVYEAKASQRPVLSVEFDSTERYMIWQLLVKNMGGSTAYNIRIEWLETSVNDELRTIKPKDRDGDVVCFSKITGHDVIVSLPKNATFAIWVDEFYSFLDANKPASFLARLTFQHQIRGGEVREVFVPISLGHGRVLTYINEVRRTEFELQKLPKALNDIAGEVRSLREQLTHTNEKGKVSTPTTNKPSDPQ